MPQRALRQCLHPHGCVLARVRQWGLAARWVVVHLLMHRLPLHNAQRFGAKAAAVGQAVLARGGSALDAVEAAVNFIEQDTTEQYFVGVGGLPNSDGVMELDAGIMDGRSCAVGAVLAIPDIGTPGSNHRWACCRTRRCGCRCVRLCACCRTRHCACRRARRSARRCDTTLRCLSLGPDRILSERGTRGDGAQPA